MRCGVVCPGILLPDEKGVLLWLDRWLVGCWLAHSSMSGWIQENCFVGNFWWCVVSRPLLRRLLYCRLLYCQSFCGVQTGEWFMFLFLFFSMSLMFGCVRQRLSSKSGGCIGDNVYRKILDSHFWQFLRLFLVDSFVLGLIRWGKMVGGIQWDFFSVRSVPQ